MSEEMKSTPKHKWSEIILDMVILMAIVSCIGFASKEGMQFFARVSPCEDLLSIVNKNQMDAKTGTNPSFIAEFEKSSQADPQFVNARDGNLVTPTMWICYANFNDALRDMTADIERLYYLQYILKQKGLDINAVDKDGFTALHWAAWSGLPYCVTMLLDAGMDMNQQENNGYTPLMLAAMRGNAKVVTILLARGADAQLTNKAGQTAAYLAESKFLSYKQSDSPVYVLIYSGHRDYGHELTAAIFQGREHEVLAQDSVSAKEYNQAVLDAAQIASQFFSAHE